MANKSKQSDLAPSQTDMLWLGLYVLLGIGCLAFMVFQPQFRKEAFLGLIITLAALPIGLRATSQGEQSGVDTDLSDRLDRLAGSIEVMTRESGLSEAAKRVLHRREERDLLCTEIERDIADEDWDAAMVLVRELAERFGYRADAEQFRARVEAQRAQSMERTVHDAINNLGALVRDHRWADAFAEAGRISRLFPESPRVEGLHAHVEEARNRYKLDLERRFLHAAERDEIDDAMGLMKELDSYLTEDESEQFREVARGVIGKARDNLGVRFKLAIQDRNWVGALEVGERIIADFPNTRMSGEVRSMIDMLRTKAATMSSASRATAPEQPQ